MVRAYAPNRKLSFAWPRVFFLYGPRRASRSGSCPPSCARCSGASRRPCSHGRQIRDYLHVQDVADGLVAVLDAEVEGAVNVSSGQATTLREIVLTAGRLVGPPGAGPARRAARAEQRRPARRRRQRARRRRSGGTRATTSSPGSGRPSSGGVRRTTRRASVHERHLRTRHRHGRRSARPTRSRRRAARPVLFDKRAHYGGHTASYAYEGDGTRSTRVPTSPSRRTSGSGRSSRTRSTASTRCCTRKVNNHWKGHWIKHPAQVNLHGLPTDLVVKIIADFVAAKQRPPAEIRNYEEWLRASFGDTFAETFPMEYTVKYHTTTARQHEHRLDRAAPVPGQARGGAPRGARPEHPRRPLHRRVPLPDARRLRLVPAPLHGRPPSVRLGHEVGRHRPAARKELRFAERRERRVLRR